LFLGFQRSQKLAKFAPNIFVMQTLNHNGPAKTSVMALVIIGLTLAVSCGPSSGKRAQTHLSQAERYYQAKQFNEAKLELDTVMEKYPSEIKQFTLAKDLMRKINIEEQNQNIVFLDSMLEIKQKELEPLLKNFDTQEIEGLPANLVHKRQKTTNSFNRTYIKPVLDIDGNYYIVSHYCGQSTIEHNQIKVYLAGNAVTSEAVEFDESQNRRFNDAVYRWEIVQYKDGKDNGVIDFIAQNHDKPIKAQFIGKTSHYIVLETFDKEAIRDSYEISFILKEIARINTEKANAQKALDRLK
jgi:hypothetical protein